MTLVGGRWLVVVSFMLAMVFSVMRFPTAVPGWFVSLGPEWMVMVLFFWAVQAPERVGVIVAWLMGFPMDVMLGEPLGLNGACYAGVIFLGWSLYERIRMFSSLQQAAVLFVLLFVIGLVKVTAGSFIDGTEWSFVFVVPTISTTLLWFPVSRFLCAITTRYNLE